MTRINLVNAQDLADQHLMAEWREIKMIPPALRRSLAAQQTIYDMGSNNPRIVMSDRYTPIGAVLEKIPPHYTLNAGHVMFFYDKLAWLKFRYEELTQELLTRGYDLSDTRPYDVYISEFLYVFHQSFVPTVAEKKINIERIVQRLYEKPEFYRFHGDVMPPSFFEDRYNQQLIVDELS